MSDVISTKGPQGIGFCGLLAIVFIVLKLTNIIAWSWLWVLSPIWIPFAIAFISMILFLAISFYPTCTRKYIRY